MFSKWIDIINGIKDVMQINNSILVLNTKIISLELLVKNRHKNTPLINLILVLV